MKKFIKKSENEILEFDLEKGYVSFNFIVKEKGKIVSEEWLRFSFNRKEIWSGYNLLICEDDKDFMLE